MCWLHSIVSVHIQTSTKWWILKPVKGRIGCEFLSLSFLIFLIDKKVIMREIKKTISLTNKQYFYKSNLCVCMCNSILWNIVFLIHLYLVNVNKFTYISELNISKPQSIVLNQFIHTEEGLTIFLYG